MILIISIKPDNRPAGGLSREMEEAERVKIVRLNKDACRQLKGKLFEMHLELSSSPPPEWCRFFQDAWEETFFHTNTNIQILEGEIIIPCTPDELQQEHMFYLKRATELANENHAELLQQRLKYQNELKTLRSEQKQRLDDIETQLDFS
jgi:hypothetical protein